MADIGEYAQQVAEQFCERQRTTQGQHNLDLPGVAVEELVRAVFYASMTSDEGRHPAVCLMCYRRDAGKELHFPFAGPRLPTAIEIAKLAHAVEYGSHLCVLNDQGKLLLGGIHVTMLDQLRQFGFSSFRTGNPLKLLIRGPGHIEASTGGIALIYRAGVIHEERLLQYGNVMGALASAVAAELAGQTTGPIESLEDVFNILGKAMVRLGHGGMLIVARRPDLGQFKVPRPINCPLLRQLLIRYWNAVAAAGGAAALLAEGAEQTAGSHLLQIASATTMVENCLSSIGQLAGMDGAIVMDYACNVVAFNAIIDKSVKAESEARLVEWCGRSLTDDAVVGNRGSRHQSALLYAKRVPGSFVFVISQDGGVTALHNQGDGTVLCELGLRVLE